MATGSQSLFSAMKGSRADRAVVRRFCLFELIYWIGNTTFYSFYVLFMTNKQLSNTEIGSVLSISALLLLVFLPVWGVVSDKLSSTKTVLHFLFIVSIIIMLCIPQLPGRLSVAIAMCVLAVFESGIVSLADGYIMQTIHHMENISYGKIRLWGSVGSVLSLAFSSILLTRCGANVIFYVYGGVLLSLLFLLRTLPRGGGSEKREKTERTDLRLLFKNREYVLFVLFACIIAIPFRFTQSFLVVLTGQVGGENTLSYTLLAGSISEGVFYALSFFLSKKFKATQLIVISGAFFVLRQLLFLVCRNPIQIVLANITLGPSFSLFTAASVRLVFDLAPQNLKSSAHAIANAAIFGVSGIISNFTGGLLIDLLGVVPVIQAGFVLSMVTYILYILFFFRLNGRTV